jgi:Ca-activated chloride channel homolog
MEQTRAVTDCPGAGQRVRSAPELLDFLSGAPGNGRCTYGGHSVGVCEMNLRLSAAAAMLTAMTVLSCQCGGPAPCSGANDCAADQVCLSTSVCAATCTSDSQCGPGEKCSKAGGCVASTGCGTDSDCSNAQVCDHGSSTCQAHCATAGCPSGEKCRSDGQCVSASTPDNTATGCGGELFQSTRVASNFLIVLDQSCSMREDVGGSSKWSAASSAVKQVTSTFGSQIRFGLEMFPGPDHCQQGSMFVPVADNTAAQISSSLPPDSTGSGTPIGLSLQLAENAPELKDATRSNNVLLITDGKENCSGNPVQSVKNMFAAGIKTYVVGFGGEVDAAMLSTMATEGGTARSGTVKYYQADQPSDLNTALNNIAQGALGCDFKLATAPKDPAKIFVYVNGQLQPRDPSKVSGWEYTSATNRITFFGGSCELISKDPNAKVSIVYGCPDDSLAEGGATDGGSTGPIPEIN